MLSLRYAVPDPDLHGFVSSYYLFWANLPQIVDKTRADLPQIRFMLSGRGFYTFGDGRRRICPDAMVTGATTAATEFSAHGPLLVFGVGLLPQGWNALIGANAAEMTDDVEDAHAVFGSAASRILCRLRDMLHFEEMVAVANRFFRAQLQKPRERPMDWFTHATDSWLMGELSPRIEELMRDTGLSARQLERLTNRFYGAPPKLLARKYRTLRLASRMLTATASWQDMMGDAFYDQSHFIREFKHFTGQTPRQFQLNPSPVAKLMSARRQLGSALPLLALES